MPRAENFELNRTFELILCCKPAAVQLIVVEGVHTPDGETVPPVGGDSSPADPEML